MHLQYLEVVDFRNHPAAAVTLPVGVSALVGPNGVGKTNLLEAVGYLATLGSHRPGQDAALVRVGAPAAVIRAAVIRAERRMTIEAEIRPGSGVHGRVNRAPVARGRDLLGVVQAIMFAPEDLGLVRGDPEERRRLLDLLAVQRLPRYLGSKQDYDRVLRQRNTLLRSAAGRLPQGGGLATLDVWDDKLTSLGAEVWAERLRLVEALRPRVEAAYNELSGHPASVELSYIASVGPEAPDRPDSSVLAAAFHKRLQRDRTRELERGITLSGPHRDDVRLVLGTLPARTHASQGEAWTLALALRLAAHRLLAEDGEEPVLLLDDVFTELDRHRRERLANIAMAVEQCIVTGAVPEEFPPALHAAMFHVEPGAIRSWHGAR